jgi:hypothetical protein
MQNSSTWFFVGQDTAGCWIARDRESRKGGLFVSEVEAVKFAKREGGRASLIVYGLPPDIGSEAIREGRNVSAISPAVAARKAAIGFHIEETPSPTAGKQWCSKCR